MPINKDKIKSDDEEGVPTDKHNREPNESEDDRLKEAEICGQPVNRPSSALALHESCGPANGCVYVCVF